jgi:hypothetical protein
MFNYNILPGHPGYHCGNLGIVTISLEHPVFIDSINIFSFISFLREMREESGLIVDDFKKVGLLMFEFVGDPQLLEVHVFHSEQFRGECQESDGKQVFSSLQNFLDL